MNVEQIREYCLSLPATMETFPFDEVTMVFKVANKMFALMGLEKPDRINLKCDPERAVELREEWEEIQPGWHMSKKHWNTVHLNGRLRWEMVKELIDHSYELVVKSLRKKDREEYGL
ncbi:MAG: MmcQ/YjbR family DNA-binding protein [Bacteroidota bacterium]